MDSLEMECAGAEGLCECRNSCVPSVGLRRKPHRLAGLSREVIEEIELFHGVSPCVSNSSSIFYIDTF
jgi:hypothetical protein